MVNVEMTISLINDYQENIMRKADKKIKPNLMSLNKLSTLRLSKEELLANQKVLEEAKKIQRKVVVLPKGYSYNKGY